MFSLLNELFLPGKEEAIPPVPSKLYLQLEEIYLSHLEAFKPHFNEYDEERVLLLQAEAIDKYLNFFLRLERTESAIIQKKAALVIQKIKDFIDFISKNSSDRNNTVFRNFVINSIKNESKLLEQAINLDTMITLMKDFKMKNIPDYLEDGILINYYYNQTRENKKPVKTFNSLLSSVGELEDEILYLDEDYDLFESYISKLFASMNFT